MKKGTLIFLIVFIGINKIQAQTKDKLLFGPIGGFGHSFITNTGTSYRFNPSFNGGTHLEYGVASQFTLAFDATFRTEGIRSATTRFSNYKQDVSLHYLHLDPKINYLFGHNGQVLRPIIGIGPTVGFLVGGKSKFRSTAMPVDTVREIQSKDYYKAFDAGLSVSFGLDYYLRNSIWLNVNLVYNNSLTNQDKTGIGNQQNRSIFLNVGIMFGLGHTDSNTAQ